ncbi:hypothetical protein CKM354_000169000 [Cercospora kikuchii]|uniref:Jacalin-type lectin domain-containing protein n=1 Tax=Cercospora kikuchii TaxID=84275 RepID=A0A9P3C8C7_9PEZI|nr:uncharacterized protein CKM354_000169000 [Cercospora kikuchii]GIZ38269.1 hypothetical protein CKM354_000169000 [Cercospora kikuchii]
MPSFLKDHLSFRRRSRASIKEPSSASASGNSSENGNDETTQIHALSKSSSTLASYAEPKTSPPTTLSSSRSNTNLSVHGANGKAPPVPARPRMPSSQSNRYSISGMPAQNCERPTPSTSPLAPRVLSVSDGSWVHQKVLLIFGQCAEPSQPIDGTLTVCHHNDNFPPISWPVCDSHFKALVHLQPGPNRLRLDFTSPKLPSTNSSIPAHSSWININFLPLNAAPPIQLCILVAKDSPETYDAVPERVQKEGNGLSTAVRKFKMAAYLWQAFTAEQMNRSGFGRRCYRYEEEWQPGTLTWKDMETGQMRNEARIHIVRMDKTVAEIQDLDVAQQHGPAQRKGDLYKYAMDAVKNYFGTKPGQVQYISAMFLDSHWDKQAGTVRGHAALGGGDGSVKLAIFGSHCLQSYPAHLEEVVPAFSDCTRTDTDYVANDCNEGGSNWEAANIGIGAHLHETGHLLGCPHQESGVMLRDYTTLNRTFLCREPYSTRTKQQGQRLCLPKDECSWHRLDTLRFRFHPTFQLPNDPAMNADRSVQVWTVDNNNVLVTAATGVAWIEIYPEGDDLCHQWIEYVDQTSGPGGAPRLVTLTEDTIQAQLPKEKRKRKINLKVFSCGGEEHEVKDFSRLCSKDAKIKLPDGRPGFKSSKLGHSQMDGSQPQQLILGNFQKQGKFDQKKLLMTIRVYHGAMVDGLEFFYEDGVSELFGKRGGKPGGSDFSLNFQRGELLLGFYVRAGAWIDGIQIMTTTGRRSEIFGKATGGSGHTLIPPRGYNIAGIYGSCAQWLDGFGLIISK